MEELTKYLYEIGQLKIVQRSGWWLAGIAQPESVAEHSFRAAIIGYILARLEGADPAKTVVMCLFHNTYESRIDNRQALGKRSPIWKPSAEEAFREQTSRLPEPISQELLSLMDEFNDLESVEARITYDAELLESLIQAREYQSQGFSRAGEWINEWIETLTTGSAKKIALDCLEMEPRGWQEDIDLGP